MTLPIETVPLDEVLARIEAWHTTKVPLIHASLRPGVTDAELNALETKTGLKLPDAYRELYRWHDGQNWAVGSLFGLGFLPLTEVISEWQVWQDIIQESPDMNDEIPSQSIPSGCVQDAYVTPGWLPFLTDGGGNSVGVDLNPGPAGVNGQVINFGRDEEKKYVLADSLDSFLREYLRRLEAGRVQVAGHERDTSSVHLLNVNGEYYRGIASLAELFPGFGTSPGVWQR